MLARRRVLESIPLGKSDITEFTMVGLKTLQLILQMHMGDTFQVRVSHGNTVSQPRYLGELIHFQPQLPADRMFQIALSGISLQINIPAAVLAAYEQDLARKRGEIGLPAQSDNALPVLWRIAGLVVRVFQLSLPGGQVTGYFSEIIRSMAIQGIAAHQVVTTPLRQILMP